MRKRVDMRVVVFSLVDDWELGPNLKEAGHRLVGWVRPAWETPRSRPLLVDSTISWMRVLCSRTTPSGRIVPRYDTCKWLEENGIPKISCADVNAPSFAESLRRQDLDLIVVGVYPQIFRSAILQVPRKGIINYHPSALPRYAGPQPIFWAMKNGEKEIGITVHAMVEKVDAGCILAQEILAIKDEENAGQVLQRQHHRGAYLLAETVTAIAEGRGQLTAQNLTERSYFGKRKPKDVVPDWNGPAEAIVNLVRALQPFEPLKASCRGRNLKIFGARAIPEPNKYGEPGQILSKRPGHLLVRTGKGCLEITGYEVEPLRGWINRLVQLYFPPLGARLDNPAYTEKI